VNSNLFAYTDRDDQGAVQIFTADLVNGGRTQVTDLPPATRRPPARTCCPLFADAQTISFLTVADVDGSNRDGDAVNATVKTDGTGLKVTRPPVVIPGSQVVTTFEITGQLNPFLLRFPTPAPVNRNQGGGGLGEIQEVFVSDGRDVLQLTNFQRQDTWSPTLSADGQRVFFSASAPSGDNPYQDCQVFSIDLLGGDLQQLTHFSEGPYFGGSSPAGCHSGPWKKGCTVFYTGRDAPSDTLLFYSSCDPFGDNPNGDQLFAMRPDGTGLSQLTETQPFAQAGGRFAVEMPFPWAYPGLAIVYNYLPSGTAEPKCPTPTAGL
jgi:hypothetical protein